MPYSDTSKRNESPPASSARTWVAVFDGGRAAIFQNDGFDDAPALRLVLSLENENKKNHQLGRDKPGRVNTPDGRRSSVEICGLHDRKETEFVNDFFDTIEAFARRDVFDRIVLLAPAQGVRSFRERAHVARARLAGVKIGDYAHAKLEGIENAFKQAMGPKQQPIE